MNRNQAMRLWDGLANKVVGGEAVDAIEQCTAFGAVVLSHGLPQTCYELNRGHVHCAKAAAFLRKWADSLESIESKT